MGLRKANTPTCKKDLVTEASTTTTQNTHLGDKGSPPRRLMTHYSESRKEAARPTPPSDIQDNNKSSHMEHQDNVWSWKNRPSGKGNEELHDWSPRTQWDEVAVDRTAETFIRRAATVLRTHRGWSPPHWGRGPDSGTRGTASAHRLGTCELVVFSLCLLIISSR